MNPTRKTDESFYRLFSASHTVSEHLTKREDSELRDKYDHNAFCYYSQPSADEVRPRWPTRKSGETPSSSWKGTSRWPMHSAWSAKRP